MIKQSNKLTTTRTDTGTYIHLESRDMLAELKEAPKHARKLAAAHRRETIAWHRSRGGASDVENLAKRAVEHYLLQPRPAGRFTVPVHVFPAGKTPGAASNQFRRLLAAGLIGQTADRPLYVGRKYIHKLEDLRKHYESQLERHGFRFVEVDPGEYK